ncbi:hypothetical protein JVU11DRAFT_4238 [Chiua virens]|nr:hypothetical protein JVU11DRAFT_4238 [Chiua virens]
MSFLYLVPLTLFCSRDGFCQCDGELTQLFSQLLKQEIVNALAETHFPCHDLRARETLFEAVRLHEPSQNLVVDVVSQKRRQTAEDTQKSIKRARVDDKQGDSEDKFMVDVRENVHRSCVEQFIDHTSEFSGEFLK